MTKPQNFILSTDYAALKNDGKATLSVTLPSSIVIPASTTQTWTSTVDVGTAGASIRSRITSTKDGLTWFGNTVSYYYSTGSTVGGFSADYFIYVSVSRVGATSVQLTVFMPNQYGSSMTVSSGLARTITAVFATFIPPVP